MTIVTTSYRPKRAPRRKHKQPAIASAIVTPAPLKKGPSRHVIRLRDQTPDKASDNGQEQPPARSAIVEPKRKRTSVVGDAPDPTPEDLKQAGDAADALWRELVRRATGR
jgi:hypothetical protein